EVELVGLRREQVVGPDRTVPEEALERVRIGEEHAAGQARRLSAQVELLAALTLDRQFEGEGLLLHAERGTPVLSAQELRAAARLEPRGRLAPRDPCRVRPVSAP